MINSTKLLATVYIRIFMEISAENRSAEDTKSVGCELEVKTRIMSDMCTRSNGCLR